MCCTSDLTLAEFETLKGKMDAFNPNAKPPQEFLGGTPNWRTDLYATGGTLLSHKESIQLIKSLGSKFTPELKGPNRSAKLQVEAVFGNQEAYAQRMIDEYKEAHTGVHPRHDGRLPESNDSTPEASVKRKLRDDYASEERRYSEYWRNSQLHQFRGLPLSRWFTSAAHPLCATGRGRRRTVSDSGNTEWTGNLVKVATGVDVFMCEAYFFKKKGRLHLGCQSLVTRKASLGCQWLTLTHMSEAMLQRPTEGQVAWAEAGEPLPYEHAIS